MAFSVFSGQASPVILSDDELAELDGVDDASVSRPRFAAADDTVEWRLPTWDAWLAGGALLTVLALVAMLPVAFAFAVSTP